MIRTPFATPARTGLLIRVCSLLVLLALALLANLSANAAPAARLISSAQETSAVALEAKYTVRYISADAGILPMSARTAIAYALNAWPTAPPPNNTFYLINVRWEKTWALVTLTSANLNRPSDKDEESLLGFGSLINLLLVQNGSGWEAAIDVDEHIHDLLHFVSSTELNETSRQVLFPPKEIIRLNRPNPKQQYNGYKFMWPAGSAWRVTQGWHDPSTWGGLFPPNTSLDFDILGGSHSNSDILAASAGTVTYMCNGTIQKLVVVTTDGTSERLGYLHLDRTTVEQEGIQVGVHIGQGRKLGRMLDSDSGSLSDSCGTSNGTHIHIYFPEKPFTIDGVTFTDSNVHLGENLYSSQGGPPPTNTPTSIPNPPTNTPTTPPQATNTPNPNGSFTLSSPSYNVQPNQSVQVSVHLHSISYTFNGSNSILDSLDSQRYGAWQFQPLAGTVGPGQDFDFNRADLFTMVSPSSPGTYQVRWQMRVGGNPIGPVSTVTLNVGSGPPTATPIPAGSWHVQIYSNESLSGSTCYDAYENNTFLFKDWGWEQVPAGSCPATHFSARFTRQVDFQSGTYSFHVEHDDGGRLFVDGQQVVDGWGAAGGHDGERSLSGSHQVVVEYREATGLARLESWWRGSGFLPPNQNRDPNQWQVDYYGIQAIWNTSALSLNDGSGAIDHNWGSGTPSYGFPSDHFMVRFIRDLNLSCGHYDFTIHSDDGVKLIVNGQTLIDQWNAPVDGTYGIDLSGGSIPVTLEYTEIGGDARVHMDWVQTSACTATPGPPTSTPTSTQIPDNTPPSVSWIDPVGDGQVYVVAGGVIQLVVNAGDASGIAQVNFNRWDAVNQVVVDLGTDPYGAPYTVNADVGTFNWGWNQVNADATDNAGNFTRAYIWINRATAGGPTATVTPGCSPLRLNVGGDPPPSVGAWTAVVQSRMMPDVGPISQIHPIKEPVRPADALTFALDDGSRELMLRWGSSSAQAAMIWLNRFTPPGGSYPLNLQTIQIVWPTQTDGTTLLGKTVRLLVYSDSDGNGNPDNATLISQQLATVSTLETFQAYPVNITVPGPSGDVYIGFEEYWIEANPSPKLYAAALDTSPPDRGRSWVGGMDVGVAPNLNNLAANTTRGFIDNPAMGIVANWMIRATGRSGCAPTSTPLPTNTTVPLTNTPVSTPCPLTFSDVQASDYFAVPVQYLACRGVISGYADGTFRPNNPTTRAQLSKIVVLGFQLPIQTPGAAGYTFSDVAPGSIFFPVVETAATHSLVSGYTCGGTNPQTGQSEPCDTAQRPYFRPSNNVTRGQLSKIVVLAANWPQVNPPQPAFGDVPVGSTFYSFVATAACHGVVSGYTDGTFRPNNPATRGQISKIVYLSINSSSGCSSSSTAIGGGQIK